MCESQTVERYICVHTRTAERAGVLGALMTRSLNISRVRDTADCCEIKQQTV